MMDVSVLRRQSTTAREEDPAPVIYSRCVPFLLCLKWSRTSLPSTPPSFLDKAKECMKENKKNPPLLFLIPKHLLSKNPLTTCTSREGEIP